MRAATMAVAVVLGACGGGPGGPGPGGPGPGGGPGEGPGPDGQPRRAAPGNTEAVKLVAPGAEIVVTLDLKIESVDWGTVSFLGVKASKVDDEWMKQGERPDFFWTSAAVELKAPVTLNAPLPEGLTYFALVNQEDNPVPSEGDLTSRPVPYPGGGTLAMVIDGRFGERRTPAGAEPAPDPGATDRGPPQRFPKRMASIDLPPNRRPAGPSALLVVGRRPAPEGAEPPEAPDYLWLSKEFTPTTWPHRAELPMPVGMHVQVVLDLDRDNLPSPGEPASDPERPPGDEAGDEPAFLLNQTFHPPGAGPDAQRTPPPPAPPTATAEGGEVRRLQITSRVQLPFATRGRFVIAGLPPAEPFVWPPAARPDFIWVSPPTDLVWPVTLEAPLPDGLDLVVLLDLNQNALPDAGDLSCQPQLKYARGAADAVATFELKDVVPPAN